MKVDMVARVARAICREGFEGHGPDDLVTHKPPPDEADFNVPQEYVADGECHYIVEDGEHMWQWKRWRHYVPQARAAIEAMREPTEAMVEACAETQACDPGEAPGAWQAMIDAALNQPSPTEEAA